jgi:Ca-activated chloride channel family protein
MSAAMVNDFHFLRPAWLLSLMPMVLLLASLYSRRWRQGTWSRVVDPHLLRQLLVAREGRARRWPMALLALGWLVAATAMAGPTWKRLPRPTYTVERPTVIALDLSRAMDSEDLRPSRVAQARYKILDALDRLRGGQVGLVLYSDEPYVAAPLTDDVRVIEEMIPTLATDLMPSDGNRADRAVDRAVELLRQAGAPTGRILLITHGVDDEVEAVAGSAERAADAGFAVSILAAATADGAPLLDTRGRIVRDSKGDPVFSRPDPEDLQRVSRSGGGALATLSPDGSDLDVLLASTPGGTLGERVKDSEIKADLWEDAGASLVLLLVVLAALSFRRGWVFVVVLGFAPLAATPDVEAGVWDDLWQRRDQQASRAFAEGRNAEAAETFRDPAWKAVAQYEDGQYEDAVETLQSIVGLEGEAAVDSTYNLGNALARAGRLEEALSAYDQVLKRRPEHDDARFNRDLVERLLEDREEQGQQQCDRPQQPGQEEREDASASEGSKPQEPGANGQDGSDPGEADRGSDDGGRSDPSRGDAGDSGEPREGEPSEREVESPNAPQDRGRRGREARDPDDEPTDTGRRTEPHPGREPQGARPSPDHDASGSRDEAGTPQGDTGEEGSLTERLSRLLGLTKPPDPVEGDSGEEGAIPSPVERPLTEEAQAGEQRLRAIPIDPGGLLRAKIRRQHMQRRYPN